MSARESEKIPFSRPSSPSSAPIPEQNTPIVNPNDLARQRAALGFDDIPIAHPDEIERENRFRKWIDKQTARLAESKQLLNWKEDLKWALHADRDEKEETHPQKPAAPATPPWNHTSPSLSPRPVHAPRSRLAVPHRQQPVAPQHLVHTAPADTSAKTIDININFGALPKLPKLNFKAPYTFLRRWITTFLRRLQNFSKKQRIIFISSMSALLIGIFSVVYLPDIIDSATNRPTAPNTAGSMGSSPTYATLLPGNKDAAHIKWARVSPQDSNPVYAYVDTVDGIAINVSQQPIPDSFQPNIDEKIADLAKNYTATDKISAGSTPIYVGTSAKGPQSVILAKNNLLILIKSTNKISDDSWAKYVESLH